MRFQFMLSEIGLGLRRNLSMTISVILVTTVSLLMLGVGLLAQKQVVVMKDYWYDRVQVSIFLCGADSDKTKPSCASGEVTQAQKDAILGELSSPSSSRYVEQVFYESKQEAYQHLKEQFRDSSLVDNVTPDQMPESYRVQLVHPEQYEIVAGAFRGQAGRRHRAGRQRRARPALRAAQRAQVERLGDRGAHAGLLGAAGRHDDPADRRSPGGARPGSCGSSARRTSSSRCRSSSRA